MNWVEHLFKHKLTVYLSAIALCLCGLFSLFMINIEPFPANQSSHINIMIFYPGANPETVATQVTNKVANALQGMDNLKNIMAETFTGRSNIQFDLESIKENDLLQTQMNITQAISDLDLPKSTTTPTITVEADETNLLTYAFTSEKLSEFEMSNFINAEILPKLTTIPGITISASSVDPVIKIQLQPKKLAQYNTDISSVLNRINESFQVQSAGSLYLNQTPYLLSIDNAINNLPDFNKLIIDYKTSLDNVGNPIYLKDIATIQFEPRVLISNNINSFNGQPTLMMTITTTSGANPFEVYKKSQAVMDSLSNILPADFKISLIDNEAETMHDAFTEVIKTILIASILVLCIAYIFLGKLRTTLIPVITIPICLLGATCILSLLGLSLNIFTLLAFVIAVGLVVDDAIVVVENITHHIENGMPKYQAIIHGTHHIARTIIGITATLLAVYLPIIFCQGGFIDLLQAFAVPLAASVFVSGIVALTLTPIMCCHLITASKPSNYQRWFNYRLHKLINHYHTVLKKILKNPLLSLIIIILLISIGIFYGLKVPATYYPDDPSGTVSIRAQISSQDTIASLNKKFLSLSQFYDNDQIDNYHTIINNSKAVMSLRYKKHSLHETKQFTDEINSYLKKNKLDTLSASMDKVFGSGEDFNLRFIIFGDGTTDQINNIATSITDTLNKAPFFINAQNTINQPTSQLTFKIDTLAAARYGIYHNDISNLLSTLYGGYQLSNDFNIAGLSVPVLIQLDNNNLANPRTLDNIQINSPTTNTTFPITHLVDLKMVAKPNGIFSMNGQPSVNINANFNKGYEMTDIIPYIDNLMATQFPKLNYQYLGDAETYLEGNTQTLLVAGLGLFFIYLLLAILFNNALDPIIILLTVPFSLVSGTLSLYVFGDTLNLYSSLALITLIGLITKHGVLIVQFANQ